MSIGKIRSQILNMPAEKKVEPFSVDFAYTGTVQEYVVPVTGLYKLEVWGGQGNPTYTHGEHTSYGGKGGYSIGYATLKKGTVLYIVCGGQGTQYGVGGFNGGGSGKTGNATYCGGGGGATHIAKVTNLLSEIGKENFDKNGLIVAGGGGGAFPYNNGDGYGGSGGGISGGNGISGWDPAQWIGTGGTQTSGYAFGKGGPKYDSAGLGCSGGGYYGGIPSSAGAGGGSGWIGGVPEITYKGTTYNPSTSNGANAGNGKATISFITK